MDGHNISRRGVHYTTLPTDDADGDENNLIRSYHYSATILENIIEIKDVEGSHVNHRRHYINYVISVVFVIICLILLFLFDFLNLDIISDVRCFKNNNMAVYDKNNQSTILNYDYNSTIKSVHRIILFGDSLIGRPTRRYNLDTNILNRIRIRYPHLSFELQATGIDGNRILSLRRRMCQDVINKRPEAVIMYWDSDVSDPSIDYIASQDGIDRYTKNLIDVIKALKSSSVKYLAIAGPNLLGELPEGENARDKYLNLYRQINQLIAEQYNITYIDIRQAFLQADIDEEWNQYSGYLTQDGEHPSATGSKIEEDLFYKQLQLWYKHVVPT